MSVWRSASRFLAAAVLCAPALGLAQNALVVHDGTAGIEASALGNLTTQLTAAAYTVTANVGVPGGSLAGYRQIWDIRFNNTTPLTAGDMTAYRAYLLGGGSLFLMGENVGFLTRDDSIVTFVATLGGGTLTMTSPANAQTVNPPFTGPNAITTMTYLAAAGSATYGTGTWITRDPSAIAAAIVWPPGSLSATPSGSLIAVFDVNFMDPGSSPPAGSQQFLQNLIGYLAAPGPVGPVPVPSLSTWAMVALGLALGAAAVRFLGLRAA